MDLRPVAVAGLALVAGACNRPDAGPPPSVSYPQHVAAGGNLPPARKLDNPFASDSESVAQGAKIFVQMNCDGCHGGGAVGWVGPSLVDGRWHYGGTDGALYQSIYYGRPKGMPAYGGILSPGAIWKIISYIRAQPVPVTVPTESWK